MVMEDSWVIWFMFVISVSLILAIFWVTILNVTNL